MKVFNNSFSRFEVKKVSEDKEPLEAVPPMNAAQPKSNPGLLDYVK